MSSQAPPAFGYHVEALTPAPRGEVADLVDEDGNLSAAARQTEHDRSGRCRPVERVGSHGQFCQRLGIDMPLPCVRTDMDQRGPMRDSNKSFGLLIGGVLLLVAGAPLLE